MIGSIIKSLSIILIPALMQVGFVANASVEPEEAADALLKGIQTCDQAVMNKYIDNKYINFLQNIETGEAEKTAINTALLGDFQYEIIETGMNEEGDTAVVKVKVTNDNFGKVDNKYEDAAHEYIMDNLYSETVKDKKKLNDKCLELYIKELEKAAKGEPDLEQTIYIAMFDDGNYGWNVELSNKNAKKILGNFDIPVK
jgi:arginine decarboxylase-like protein